jgi:DNA primase
MKSLNFKNIKKTSGGFMCSCPFASHSHAKKKDLTPSFGVSIGSPSVYNCFSCHQKGYLSSLPSNLSFMLGKDYLEARDFILKNDTVEFQDYDSMDSKPEILPALNESVLKKLQKIPEKVKIDLGLDDKIIDYFELKYYNRDNRLIIPIRDNFGRLVAIKGRYVGSDVKQQKFTFYKGNNVKKNGTWLNMDKPLIKDKALLILESESDTFALHGTGLVHNIWCAMGVNTTKNQVFNLQQISNPIVFAFDGDKAGIDATNKLAKELKGLMPLYKISDYYGEKDIRDLVKTGKIKKALGSIVKI